MADAEPSRAASQKAPSRDEVTAWKEKSKVAKDRAEKIRIKQERREKKKKKDAAERRKGPKREPRAKKHYRGVWKANAEGTELPHGLGVWHYDGTHTFYPPKLKDSLYEGSFKAGMRQGPGSCKYKDNGVYEGLFRKDDRHGHGVYTETNGNRYEGEWVKDERHGVGIFSSPEGERYEGDFVQNRREGFGVGVRKDGTKQEGRWSKNLFIEPDGAHHYRRTATIHRRCLSSNARTSTPSCPTMRLIASGGVTLTSTHEQILSPLFTFVGAAFPQSAVHKHARARARKSTPTRLLVLHH